MEEDCGGEKAFWSGSASRKNLSLPTRKISGKNQGKGRKSFSPKTVAMGLTTCHGQPSCSDGQKEGGLNGFSFYPTLPMTPMELGPGSSVGEILVPDTECREEEK